MSKVTTGTILHLNPDLRHPVKVSAMATGIHTMQEMRDFVAQYAPEESSCTALVQSAAPRSEP